MVDMSDFIAPKSDQLNAEDLISGPRTVKVLKVRASESTPDQPVEIHIEGSTRPYKPCKSMRRVMVHLWGADAQNYIGRSMTLYRDPEVQFGGMKVGGIRISEMSHIERDTQLVLTASKAKRAPYTVKKLIAQESPAQEEITPKSAAEMLKAAATMDELIATWKAVYRQFPEFDDETCAALKDIKDAVKLELEHG